MTHYQLFDPLPREALEALKADIKKRGVLVPIEVDESGEILDGHHRAAIADELGIECPRIVRRFETEQERIEHVYKLNLLRRHMDSASWGRAFLKLLEMRGVRYGQGARNDQNVQTSATVAEVAREVGVPERTARERVAHADSIDRYPFMQGPNWKQYHVLEAREQLEKLPEEDRATLASIASEPAVPPQDAIHMFRRMAEMKPPERAEVRRLFASDDRRDKSLAKTRLVELPPEPDPRTIVLASVLQDLNKCIRAFPNDSFTPEIESVVSRIKELAKSIKEAHNEKTGYNPGLS